MLRADPSSAMACAQSSFGTTSANTGTTTVPVSSRDSCLMNHPRESGNNDYEIVSELAFRIYEQEGRPIGKAKEHWRRAEKALQLLRLSEPPGRMGRKT